MSEILKEIAQAVNKIHNTERNSSKGGETLLCRNAELTTEVKQLEAEDIEASDNCKSIEEELVYWEQASQADENQLVEVQIRADEWQLGRMAIVHEANLSLEQRFMAAMDLKPAEVNEFMTQWEIDYLCGDKTTAPEREKILTANRAALVGRIASKNAELAELRKEFQLVMKRANKIRRDDAGVSMELKKNLILHNKVELKAVTISKMPLRTQVKKLQRDIHMVKVLSRK